jgi:pre-mRNA-processing factor 17
MPFRAKYENETNLYDEETRAADEELASDEEWVEEEVVAPAGTVTSAMPLTSTAYAPATEGDAGNETTEFHGSQEFDYQGRTYIHIPQDLDIDLRKESGSYKNYIPSKHIHTWRGHTKAITALRFFPGSGHLLLSSSADTKVKIWDVYHDRELLRTFSGHSKSVTDTTFKPDGLQFLTASFDKQMKLWDTEYGKCISRFTTGKIPHVIRFHPGVDGAEAGNEFLVGTSDNKIVQFDVRSGEKTQEYDHHVSNLRPLFTLAPNIKIAY